MSADKRSVSTDALETLGCIITEKEKRDAIHLAVVPVVAGEFLDVGEHVGIGEDGKAHNAAVKLIGIVDPFLEKGVPSGQRFWLVIYPRKITSLRHVWTHPELPDETVETKPRFTENESEKWLRNWCASHQGAPSYETLESQWGSANGERLHIGGEDAYGEIPPEVWDHLEVISGVTIPQENRAKWFSCAC